MIMVLCPNCQTGYNLDPAKLGPQGRKLKCAKCATVWVATVESAAPTPPEAPPPAPQEPEQPIPPESPSLPAPETTPGPEGVEPRLSRLPQPNLENLSRISTQGLRRYLTGEVLWLLVGALVVLAGALAAVGAYWNTLPKNTKLSLETAQKASKTAPDATTPPKNVVLRGVQGEVVDMSGTAVLMVRGSVQNTGEVSATLASLRLELVGLDDTVKDAWPIPDTSTTLAPQALVPFAVSLTSPALATVKGWRVVFGR